MKLIIVMCFVAGVAAAPASPPMELNVNENIGLLRYDKDTQADGKYNFSFEQTDGQRRDEQGQLKNTGQANQTFSVKGSYHWVGPDGVEYLVIYNADENGYKPELQQGPGGAIPAAVLASCLG